MSKKLLRIGLVLLLIGGIALAMNYRDQFDAEALAQWVEGFGMAGPLVFILIYAAATVFFLPGLALTLAGGAIFGPVWGALYNIIGATMGATLAFLVARYLAADWAEQKSGGRIKQLKDGVEAEGWRFIAFVRLVPLFPFNVLNYALGLTRIKLSHYIIASFVCMLPADIAFTYMGYVGREALAGGEGVIQKGMMALGLFAIILFLPRLIGRLRQGPKMEVTELKAQAAEMLILDVRSEKEFSGEQGHIHKALNIPVDQLTERVAELDEYRERPIAIVCRTDVRSAKAATLLGKQGFAELHVVRNGMTGWNEAGYQVEEQNKAANPA